MKKMIDFIKRQHQENENACHRLVEKIDGEGQRERWQRTLSYDASI
jgi:hypothetical protein